MARAGRPLVRRVRVRAVVCIGAGLALAGCSGGPPDPSPAADALADALAAGDVSGIGFTQPVQAVQDELDAVVAGMGAATLDVAVVETALDETTDEPRALATMQLTWDLDGDGPNETTWTYETSVDLVPADEPADESPDWLVVWNRALMHPDLGSADVLASTRTQPSRADIVGADGTALVTARPVERVGIDKVRLGNADPAASARDLAAVVGIDADSYADTVAAAGEQAFVEAIVLREQDAAAVRDEVEAIAGARLLPAELPLGPTREFARPLIGVVGPATAEIVESSAGAVAGSDVVGLSGLQARYDEQLRGSPGYVVEAVTDDDTAGRTELFSTDPDPGEPLVVTLDLATQQLADSLLADVESASGLVALRVSTGELVSVASGPGGDGYSTATLGQYAPGSIFKIVSSLGLIRADIGPSSVLPCTPSITVDGKRFRNYSDYPPNALGDITLETAFAQSCNTAFISQVDVLGWPDIVGAATSLGIIASPDLGFDAFLGEMGEPGSRVEQAAGLIGQGTVLMSPLGAAVMAASAEVGPVAPVLLPAAPPAGAGDEATVAPGENAQLTAMMRQVVTDGTGQVLADLPAPPVVAKTGTAEFGTQIPPQTHGWMVAVQGDLAVAVFVEQAESGSATAGPIMREFLQGASSTLGLSAAESR